jgi:hypothetical protein
MKGLAGALRFRGGAGCPLHRKCTDHREYVVARAFTAASVVGVPMLAALLVCSFAPNTRGRSSTSSWLNRWVLRGTVLSAVMTPKYPRLRGGAAQKIGASHAPDAP